MTIAAPPRPTDGYPAPLSDADAVLCADDLLRFINDSPTPFHAVGSAISRLQAAGFRALSLAQTWAPLPPGNYYISVGDSALVAFALPEAVAGGELRGFRILGAHTDSPNLRLKPRAPYEKHGYLQLGVEVYGGALLNTWLDRDLYIAGRVLYRDGRGEGGRLQRRLVQLAEPLVRVAQLAIHLDREINDKGLLLNRQEHLAPIAGLSHGLGASRTGVDGGPATPDDVLRSLLARALDLSPDAIVGSDLMLADANPARRGGLDSELLYAPRLDNQAMCHAAVHSLLRASSATAIAPHHVPLIALFDNEEVGSGSAYGAEAPILPTILERIVAATSPAGDDRRDRYLRALAASLCVSADMAHAVHPNYADRHEPHHRPRLNGGPVIKHNAQQRYATCGRTAALFADLCERAGVPVQHYVHRTDLPCGTTIGPITSTQLGIPTVDVGNPMLSMHSARECAGARDPELMVRALACFLGSRDELPG
jgi:aspartyl aminopeptidase